LRLELLGTSVVFGAAFFAVLERDNITPGLAGLSITYALMLTNKLNWLVRMSTEVENQMVSVERALEYSELQVEKAHITDIRPPVNWPDKGEIEFNNLTMKYRSELPPVLKGISCQIKGHSKVGIVGRTGSGKSSLMMVLFRLIEPFGGTITIDGIDITTIGLDDLRGKLAIIPQDPTLFTGTIRSNLDPFNNFSEDELWQGLKAVHLQKQVEEMEGQLVAKVAEFGANLSVGTRQLMCLARALLRKAKIIVLDEATASVDFETDSLIQATIKDQFQDATVLTIAHRINTIVDSDYVMVLKDGQIIEYDRPDILLQSNTSLFSSLVNESKTKQ